MITKLEEINAKNCPGDFRVTALSYISQKKFLLKRLRDTANNYANAETPAKKEQIRQRFLSAEKMYFSRNKTHNQNLDKSAAKYGINAEDL